ncbi:hypothetical protein [Bacillus sp. TL12]|uniref:hypothetical protein n=1 Tax=Bacillus sp. TL12 TaxID=2894756 RepID=UPI001F528B56|nr:hypothetical protein [Bacillus sp. TL12]MCI0766936.1 hypothetical protein [Bacillus sp. TL12]
MRKKSPVFGLIAGIVSILLWIILNFFNPYSNQENDRTVLITLVMLVLPACIAMVSFFISKKILMLIAFIWSFLLSLYLLMTPSIFILFGITNFTYLFSYILMRKELVAR